MKWVPPTFQGDFYDPLTGEHLYAVIPWWLNYPRPPAPSLPAVTLAEEVVPAVTPPLPGGWTSAFGYMPNIPR